MAASTSKQRQQDDSAWEAEQQEWLDALANVLKHRGEAECQALMMSLQRYLGRQGVPLTEATLNTAYKNTIELKDEPRYPGDIEVETRLANIIRWNAVAMVLQAFDSGSGVGGHIATYLSACTMMEVGLNHIFHAGKFTGEGDEVHFQAHTSPGIYARAWLEGRLSDAQISNFRRELGSGGGLPSYPHPRRLPWFWTMPCASMGLSTPCAIYRARFAKYLESRGLKRPGRGKIWAFVGDGETDEPEVLGTINIASREELDNLVLVVNCNLQRLDGPVRGNGKIIQELERAFRGADWHVIKVVWGSGWDPILARDNKGVLQARMEQALDGDYQMYTVSSGDAVREHWVEHTPELRELMKTLSDEEVRSIKRGGQDHRKIHAAFRQAAELVGKPCVVLLKTVKGDGLGPGAEGANTVHQKKHLSPDERRDLAARFGIPLSDDEILAASFYRPPEDAPEMRYLKARRQALGGFLPQRQVRCPQLQAPDLSVFEPMLAGSERQVSTTMSVVRMLSRLLRDKTLGRYIVPIVPDEARTFGMDGLFPQAGIYSPEGQRYRPVDAGSLAPYKESEDGQILQEGICETGAMASFLAAGSAYASHGLPMIPFYIFYSMFGFQRVGDMIWAAGDMMCKGFLLGGTSGRTTLNGEGVQHQDGHSQLIASTVPNLRSYDPAFAFEIALIVREGIRVMYEAQEDAFYYLTVTNQACAMPALARKQTGEPEPRVLEGVLKGMYCLQREPDAPVNLMGSGAMMVEVLRARDLLRACNVACNIWSVTSYNELAREARRVERQQLVTLGNAQALPFVQQALAGETGVFVAASDYMKALPGMIAPWIPGPYTVLGTDGFGLSESRDKLRSYFEVSGEWIAFAALASLAKHGLGSADAARRFAVQQGVDLEQTDPARA